jgi:hypothetical protein
MRLYRRADRTQYRLGNSLPDVSGEIMVPAQLAEGTGTHQTVEPPPATSARRRPGAA